MELNPYKPLSRQDVLVLHFNRMSEQCGDPTIFRRQVQWWEMASQAELEKQPDLKAKLEEWDPSHPPPGWIPEDWQAKCWMERFGILTLLHDKKALHRETTNFDEPM